jgi:mRNA-degrading endonuclease RelE of RelBE toxin-antitoxin system
MRIEFTSDASSSLLSVPTYERKKIQAKIKAFGSNPRGQYGKWVKPFTASTGRIRQGDWRALYLIDWENEIVMITAVDHRSKVYR